MKDNPFVFTRMLLPQSTCLKLATAASVWKNGSLLGSASNLCAPSGISYGQCVPECPRMHITTGGQYELCRPVHAEVLSCLNIRAGRNEEELASFASHMTQAPDIIRATFTKRELQLLNGATLYLAGHYWACESCLHFLRAVGITDLQIDDITGEATRSRYQQDNIT